MKNQTVIIPELIIKRIRESYKHSVTVYTQGGCYQFYLILEEIFPEAIAWYCQINGHIYTEINGKFYDITGEVDLPETADKLENEPRILEEAKNWEFDWGYLSNQIY